MNLRKFALASIIAASYAVLLPCVTQAQFTDIGAGLVGASSIAWGDYDNDGDLDIAIVSAGAAYAGIHIYRNDGNGQFVNIKINSMSVHDGCIAWGDYDNDGDLDIAVAGSCISGVMTKIYRNDGNGIFTDIGANLEGTRYGTLAWGDYDNDGDLDLAISGDGTTTKIYRNDGNNTFADIGVNIPANCAIAWGDYDNDGNLDLAIASEYASSIYGAITRIYRNNSHGQFIDINANLPGITYGSLAWGDYDNDGDLDLAIAGMYGGLYISKIYRNDGNGIFTDINANLQGVIGNITWGDYDNDGDLDLAVTGASGTSHVSKIYRNDGNDIFTDSGANLAGLYSISWGDYDNDGDLDLAAIGIDGNGNLNSAKIYRNDMSIHNSAPNPPDGLLATVSGNSVTFKWNAATDAQTPSSGLSYNLRVGTTPGSGNVFSAMADQSNGFRKIPALGNSQKGLSWSLKNLPPGTYYWSVQAIDTDYTGSTWATEQSFTVSAKKIAGYIKTLYGVGTGGVSVAANNDGPIVATNSDGYYELYVSSGWSGTLTPKKPGIWFTPESRNYSNIVEDKIDQNFSVETFTDTNINLAGYFYYSSAWGDYDNDGDLDLFIVGNCPGKIFRNDGNDVLTDIGINLPAADLVVCGDYDNDGDLDFVIVGDNSTRIYRNDGNGTFIDIGVIIPGISSVNSKTASWVDYNNDGKLDLVITGDNFNNYLTQIYKNVGNDTFISVSTNLPAASNSSLAWGDYDNDGSPDVALAGYSNNALNTKIYHNDGNGKFTDIGANIPGAHRCSLAWGDFDNDGNLDLAVASSATTTVYKNDGNGKFTNIAANMIGVYDCSVAWGDSDNDGDLDLIVAGNDGNGNNISKIYRNDGNGQFVDTGANLMGIEGIYSCSVTWGDFDNDSDLDLAIIGDSSGSGTNAKIYRNDELAHNTAPNSPSGLYATATGNYVTFNWSAATDAQTPSNGLSYNLRVGTSPGAGDVFSGMANPTNGQRQLPALGNVQMNHSWTLKDLPLDTPLYWSVQAIDTAFAGSAWAEEKSIVFTAYKISGHIRTADGTGIAGVNITVSNGGPAIITGTDGYYEVYVSPGWSGTITPSKPACQFTQANQTYSNVNADITDQNYIIEDIIKDIDASLIGVSHCSTAWGDYDNDGDLDLAIAGSSASKIYRNDGNGAFVDISANLVTGVSCSLAWGDYDNDGNLDLAIAGGFGFGATKIYHNDGSGKFTDIGGNIVSISSGSLAWGDYDNDGDLDLAITGIRSGSYAVARIYRNDGKGKFTNISASMAGVSGSCISWGDYDNDGYLDLIIIGNSSSGYVNKIYHNNGSGNFTDIGANLAGVYGGYAAWGDYDNDGDLDLAIAGYTASKYISKIYRNDGNGVFVDICANLIAVNDCSLAWGDYDNDGYLDLAIAGRTSSNSQSAITKIYHNDGKGNFTETSINLIGLYYSSLAWGDYDNDGDLDLVTAGTNGTIGISKIYRNDIFAQNTAPNAPSCLSTVVNGNNVTFSWNAASDAQTPSAGLSYNLRVGTAPGSGDIFNAMSNSTTGLRKVPALGNVQKRLSWTLKDLPACKLYWSVQAIDTSYVGSAWANDATDYIITNKTKLLTDGTTTCIKGIVTAIFSDCCYVEAEDRSSGIRVETSASLSIGDKVYVAGTMATNPDGERYIAEATVTPIGSGSINPVNLTNRNLGGGDLNFSVGAGQCGVSGGFGLNNIGMLVKTTGKVMLVGDGCFYIDDGSNVQDSVSRGVRVTCESGILMPEKDHYVTVTGISSIMKTDSGYYRNLRATDIKLIK